MTVTGPFTVGHSTDAVEASGAAGGFLASDPVRHNVILTLLQSRIVVDTPGRYWWVTGGSDVVGFVFHSPLSFNATLTPMPSAAVEAVVEHVAGTGVGLPGISGDAATAARFAGHWTEATKTAAAPSGGQRIYEAHAVTAPATPTGRLRQAKPDDAGGLVEWLDAFGVETGDLAEDAAALVGHRVGRGDFWVWETDEPVSMAARTPAVGGVTRVQAVYTPPGHRNRGYAGAVVAAISAAALDDGLRPILYSDLANPTSNSLYRRIGYRAVEEVLRYRFNT